MNSGGVFYEAVMKDVLAGMANEFDKAGMSARDRDSKIKALSELWRQKLQEKVAAAKLGDTVEQASDLGTKLGTKRPRDFDTLSASSASSASSSASLSSPSASSSVSSSTTSSSASNGTSAPAASASAPPTAEQLEAALKLESELCSDDDIDVSPDLETSNLILCQYDKISFKKGKWEAKLRDGIVHHGGVDYAFSTAKCTFNF